MTAVYILLNKSMDIEKENNQKLGGKQLPHFVVGQSSDQTRDEALPDDAKDRIYSDISMEETASDVSMMDAPSSAPNSSSSSVMQSVRFEKTCYVSNNIPQANSRNHLTNNQPTSPVPSTSITPNVLSSPQFDHDHGNAISDSPLAAKVERNLKRKRKSYRSPNLDGKADPSICQNRREVNEGKSL
ncbi:MAG: hypothetical protein M1834_002618 [Cirrosporium novae-zelandiae]|nr:MAG: hypothetical protein M1834_002618 [Cirrosporium novae-zelandiae]